MYRNLQFGVNAFGCKKLIARDGFPEMMKKLKSYGFNAFEPMLIPEENQGKMPGGFWSAELLREQVPVCREMGISMHTTHVALGLKEALLPAETAAEWILRFHEISGTEMFITNGLMDTEEEARRMGRYLKEVNRKLESSGCCFLYHNHDAEFRIMPGTDRLGLDFVKEEAEEYFYLENDFGWAGFAGDEVEAAKTFAGDIRILHCKDFYPEAVNGEIRREDLPESAFAPIGSGVIRTEEVLKLMTEGTFPNFKGIIILDQDESGGDMLEDLRIGIGNVKRMLGNY